ncbi:DUF805 domain-containing protein [Acidipropionibacterium acidipropionici]|uniref:DUF805 domain-containing protein n=1 Tax=Acidipropionibacterium acidipropionici TaxID=1748 RepID=UPI00110AE13B|nr:DUF805 domain-containing protein [Acidipropionibacterium acidipropionici]QCV94826.1 DUF805 domain-containing protein [Acidipropionibacterium acidipropionici]
MSHQPWGNQPPEPWQHEQAYPYEQPYPQAGRQLGPYPQPDPYPQAPGPYPYQAPVTPYGTDGYPAYPGRPFLARARPSVGLGLAVKLFFRNYAVFNGRASRSEYWFATLFNGLVEIAFAIAMVVSGGFAFIQMIDNPDSEFGATLGVGFIAICLLYGLYGLATFVPSLSITVRRLHDSGRSGLLALLMLGTVIPYLSLVFSVVLIVLLAQRPDPTAWQRYDTGRLPAAD